MKKYLCILAILVFVAVVLCGLNFSNGGVAYAENDTSYEFVVQGQTLSIHNITKDNKPIGVRFGGYYFGASGIAVTVDVYSSPAMELEFAIGGELDGARLATRDKLCKLFGDIHNFINRIDALVNTTYDGSGNLPESDIFRYNSATQGAKLAISQDTYNMLLLAREMYEQTDGAYDPAVYRLVDLWGFSSRIYSYGRIGEQPYDRTQTPNGREVTSEVFFGNGSDDGYPLPDEQYVKAFSDAQFVDFSDNAVTLSDEGGYFVTKNVAPVQVNGVAFDQWLDLGGIAKGYVVDGIKSLLQQLGLDRYQVDAGSSSMSYGKGLDGNSSTLGLADPFDPYSSLFQTALLQLQVIDCSISTSGQNVRKYTVDGVEYAHILDGATGAPAQTGVRSVMVAVPDSAGDNWAAKGDCLTTALTVMGRDRIVQMLNGLLKQLGVGVVVLYETPDGQKQILTNYSQKDLEGASDSFSEFGWALKTDENGVLYYDGTVTFVQTVDPYEVTTIVLGCILGAAVIAIVVYNVVKGRKTTLVKVRQAKKDKPFKVGDLMVYACVAVVILALFAAFVFDTDSKQLQLVTVTDDQTGETLFVYNVIRKESVVNTDNRSGWTITVTHTETGVQVRFVKVFDGEERFNELTVTDGREPTVKMTDSLCGFHQDCVRNFPEISRSGGAIVCSPNRLKVVTS